MNYMQGFEASERELVWLQLMQSFVRCITKQRLLAITPMFVVSDIADPHHHIDMCTFAVCSKAVYETFKEKVPSAREFLELGRRLRESRNLWRKKQQSIEDEEKNKSTKEHRLNKVEGYMINDFNNIMMNKDYHLGIEDVTHDYVKSPVSTQKRQVLLLPVKLEPRIEIMCLDDLRQRFSSRVIYDKMACDLPQAYKKDLKSKLSDKSFLLSTKDICDSEEEYEEYCKEEGFLDADTWVLRFLVYYASPEGGFNYSIQNDPQYMNPYAPPLIGNAFVQKGYKHIDTDAWILLKVEEADKAFILKKAAVSFM